jgi:hypothetical protein
MAWIIWSAPFKKAKLFWQKLGWGVFLLGIVSALLSFFSTLILGQGMQFWFWQFITLLGAAVFLAAAGFTMGALLPNFEEKSAEKISTSPGGILATAVSLAYLVVVGFVLFNISDYSFTEFSSKYLFIWILNVAAIWLAKKIFTDRANSYQL